MYLTAIELLFKWKKKKGRKPLIIRGAINMVGTKELIEAIQG